MGNKRLRGEDLTAFVGEYLTLSQKSALRWDIFRSEEQWHLTFLQQEGNRQLLSDAHGEILCGFDRITPLFVPREARNLKLLVDDLAEQASGLRSRVTSESYLRLQLALEGLRYNPALSCGYLVEEQGLVGIADPMGQVLVEPRYARIDLFSFRESYDTDSGGDAHTRSNAQLYLCRAPGHTLNNLDVFDLRGNCIFRGISGLCPREEALITSKPTEDTSARFPREKKLRSIWVSRQFLEHPFPEMPEFEQLREDARRFTVKELNSPVSHPDSSLRLAPMALDGSWEHIPLREAADIPDLLLSPMAEVIGGHIDASPEAVLRQLVRYEAFRRERRSLFQKTMTPDTPLGELELESQTYQCLIRSGLRTLADVLALPEDPSPRLRRFTPEILRQIQSLKEAYRKY